MRRLLAVCCLLPSLVALAKNGAYKATAHGDPDKGVQRRADVPRGSCLQCHDQQADDYRSPMQRKADAGLFAANDDNLCFVCHAATSQTWPRSSHAQARCADCHDPHGVRDRDGVVPMLLADREPAVCVRCHDGSRAADVRTQLLAPVVHGARGRQPLCSDCHDVHMAGGVSRVQVVNGAAGATPVYRLLAANEPGEAKDYEVCFKCHSSYAKQPFGQPDLARLTNPANASSHPIQAAGRNLRIRPAAFVDGMSADMLVTCASCHGNTHGSSYRHLLVKDRDDVCFDCHTRAVYAESDSMHASRFDGHVAHAGIHKLECVACHDPHGSVRNAALIATGRFPGINSYMQTPAGGTCTSSCHGLQTYVASYPR